MNCPSCSQDIPADLTFCPVCGHTITPATEAAPQPATEAVPQPPTSSATPATEAAPQPPTSFATPAPKSRVVSGVLGILLGGLGIHKFYLGYSKEGLIMLLVTIVGGIITGGIVAWIVGLIGLIEGIIYLTKSDDEFSRLYVQDKKGWF